MTAPSGPAPQGLRTDVREAGGVTVIALAGELDADDAPAVRALLLEHTARRRGLVVDVSELAFLDSAGLAALVAAHKAALAGGTGLVLAAPSATVVKVLSITGLQALLTTAPSVSAALALLRGD